MAFRALQDSDGRVRDPWLEVDEIVGLLTEVRDSLRALRDEPLQDKPLTNFHRRYSLTGTVDAAGGLTQAFAPVPPGYAWEVEAISAMGDPGAAGGSALVYIGAPDPANIFSFLQLDAGRAMTVDKSPVPKVLAVNETITVVWTGQTVGRSITVSLWAKVIQLSHPKEIRGRTSVVGDT